MAKIKELTKKLIKIATSLPIIIKIISVILICSLASVMWDFVVELTTAKNNPEKIYSMLNVENVEELVEIKESEDGSGYYLDFVEDFDQRIEEFIYRANHDNNLHNMPKDTAFLRKLIKAEVITQFPNLGGNIPEDSDGFQGAIDIRRITPNKDKGSITDNPGRGETTIVEKPKEGFYDTEMSEDEETVKGWKKGDKLIVKGEATVYEQEESVLDPEKETGYWKEKKKEDAPNESEIITDDTEVTYAGNYRTSTNMITKEEVIYVEVQKENEDKVYIRSTNLMLKEDIVKEETTTGSVPIREVSSRAGENDTEKKIAGKEGKRYTVAIAAGHNNTNDTGARTNKLKEEQLTIKTAEKVEELIKEQYSNIKVVQTGSTSNNRGNVQVKDRVRLARDAKPDLCIQIHFDAGGGSGVQGIYKDGDDVSRQLAELVSEGMAKKMGLPDKGAGPDVERTAVKNLGIIENSINSGFPSIVTEGGFIDGEPDATLLQQNGTDLCAEGIVEGIVNYLGADHSGYIAKDKKSETKQDYIESKVYNLRYVKPEQMREYMEKGNEKALEVFTLDDQKNLITVTWEHTGGTLTLQENSAMNFRTMLQKYTMPYEYLLYFYMDTNETKFSEELADEVLDSEIVIAVQDNVRTTQITDVTLEKQEASMSKYNYEDREVGKTVTLDEATSPKIEITYADTWCVKAYKKENNYSKEELGWDDEKKEETLNIRGEVTETETNMSGLYNTYESGVASTGQVDEDGKEITYTYTKYRKVNTTTEEMNVEYATSKLEIEGNENKFIKIYEKNKMYRTVRTSHLFSIIKNNERTTNLLDLTKYLMYKSTSNNYGVLEYPFESEFNPNAFQSLGEGGEYGDWDGTGSQEDFIRAVAPYAVKDMEQHKIYASVTIAQAIIESGWGKDDIAISYKNFFGMKAFDTSGNEFWSGERVALKASEGGIAYFRVYDSLGNSVYDHGRNFHVTATYKSHGVLECVNKKLGPKEQARRIAISGYAENATYADFIYQIITENSLEKYDKMTSADFESVSTGSSGVGAKVVKLAESKIGCPYVWGATGPNTFDCSGLVYWIYKTKLGINVPRTTYGYENYKGTDKQVSMDKLQPGDILLTHEHAGIYIGNDEYIHAPQPGEKVKKAKGAKKAFTYAIRMVKNTSTGGSSSNNKDATTNQQKIVKQAMSKNTLGSGPGFCEQWVERVYHKAVGQTLPYACCAGSAGNRWIVSKSKSNIPPGACVYGYSRPYVPCGGHDAGHVGIYVGNGQVASNVGGIRIESLSSWTNAFGWRGWGWNGGKDYSK